MARKVITQTIVTDDVTGYEVDEAVTKLTEYTFTVLPQGTPANKAKKFTVEIADATAIALLEMLAGNPEKVAELFTPAKAKAKHGGDSETAKIRAWAKQCKAANHDFAKDWTVGDRGVISPEIVSRYHAMNSGTGNAGGRQTAGNSDNGGKVHEGEGAPVGQRV